MQPRVVCSSTFRLVRYDVVKSAGQRSYDEVDQRCSEAVKRFRR